MQTACVHSRKRSALELHLCRADDLHVLLVEHGKCCQRCAKNGRPRKTMLGPCPLGTRTSWPSTVHMHSSALAAADLRCRADDLHVLLVEHGKCCQRCAKNGRPRKPVLGPCPLGDTQQLAKRMAAEGQDLGIPERADAVLCEGPSSGGKQKGQRKPAAEPKADPEAEPEAEADKEVKPAAEGEDSQAGKGKGRGKGKPAQKGAGRKRAKRG